MESLVTLYSPGAPPHRVPGVRAGAGRGAAPRSARGGGRRSAAARQHGVEAAARHPAAARHALLYTRHLQVSAYIHQRVEVDQIVN